MTGLHIGDMHMPPEGIAITLIWAVLIVLSVRAFWRKSNDVRKARYYADAKFLTIFVTVGAALCLPLAVPFPHVSYALEAAFWAIISFPITLCGMYWASRVFHSIVDQRHGR